MNQTHTPHYHRIITHHLLLCLDRLYLHSESALGVALVGQREAERASRLMLRLLQMRRYPPDEEPSRGEDGPAGTLLQLKEERRALRVGRGELEDEVLPGERPQAALRPVEGRGLVDWRGEERGEEAE